MKLCCASWRPACFVGEKTEDAGRGRAEVTVTNSCGNTSRAARLGSHGVVPSSPQQSLPRAQSLAQDSFLLTCEGSVIAKVLPFPISAKSLAFMAVTVLGFQLALILQRWGW